MATEQKLQLIAEMSDRQTSVYLDTGQLTFFTMNHSVHFVVQHVTSICYTLVAPG